MFVKCPRCHSLVATDAVTGAPPDYCPYCDGPIAGHPDLAENSPSVEAAAEPESVAEATAAEQDAAPAPAENDDDAAIGNDDAATSAPIAAGDADDAPSSATIATDDAAAVAIESAAMPVDTATEAAVAQDKDESAKQDVVVATAHANPKPKPRKKKRGAPSFVRRPAQAPDRPTPVWFWAIAGGLALLAGLQIVLADRAQLAADARWRPLIASACGALRCALPPWRDPGAFAMLRRDVRQHPYMPGALRVDATFRNNARWAQPWPELVLTLSDVDGRALGMRAFSPQEYLDKKVTQKEIASGQNATIRLEVMEPAAGVVSFSFDFR